MIAILTAARHEYNSAGQIPRVPIPFGNPVPCDAESGIVTAICGIFVIGCGAKSCQNVASPLITTTGNGVTPSRIAVVLSLILAFGAHAAEDSVLLEAKALMDARQPQQAYDLLKPLEEDEAGNPDYDFLLGIAALDSGHNTEAIFALQRVVDQQPKHGPARAELARALMQANESDAARRELETLRGQDPPSDVKRVVEEYLAAIDRYHGAYRSTFARYVHAGLGFDTNVNNATNRGAVAAPGLGGLTFALAADSRELDSSIWNSARVSRFLRLCEMRCVWSGAPILTMRSR